jgi:DNA-binding CsgD family transcriptional regulator
MFRRLDQLAFGATSVRGALCGRGRQPSHDPSLLELLAAAGEHCRLLVDPELAMSPGITDRATRRQLEVRVHGGGSLRPMLVFDDRYAVVPLDQNDLGAGALLLRAPLVAPCGQLFECLWSHAQPLGGEPGQYGGLSTRELDVVHLLVHGATDNQVANRLGLSSRTVRNVVSELHRRFGTTSRMALGFQLAERSPHCVPARPGPRLAGGSRRGSAAG